MARNTAETIFTGDAEGLVAAYQKMREENRKQEQELRELSQAQRAAHNEERQSLRDAERMIREVQTPLEQYRQKVNEIERAYESGSIDQETYNRQLQRQKDLLDQNSGAADTFGAKISAGVGTFVKQMAGFAAGLISISGVVRAIRAEAEDFRRRNAEAFLANTDYGTIMRNTRQMFTADATVSDEQLQGRVMAASTTARTSPKIIAEALAGAFSAKGQLSNDVAIEAVTQAFRLTPNDLASGSQLAARSMDISKQSGVNDIRGIIGFLQNVTANSRVTSIEAVGQYGVPAMNAIATRGDSLEQAGELFATLNQLMSDAEGRLSKTAAINLSSKLAEFKPTAGGDFGVPQEQVEAYLAAGSTTERIAVAQSSPQLRQQLLAKTSFDAASSAFIEKLLAGTKDALASQAAAAAGIAGLATPQEQAAQRTNFEATVSKLDRSAEQQLLANKQRADVTNEQAQISNTDRGRIGQVKEQLQETLENVNLFGPVDSILRWQELGMFSAQTALGQSPEQRAIDVLNRNMIGLSQPDRALFEAQIELLQEQLDLQKQARDKPQPVRVENADPRPPAAAQARMR